MVVDDDLFSKTEPEKKDPTTARGVGLRQSEWAEIERLAEQELNISTHALAVYAIRDFVKRYKAGEIETRTQKTLADL